MARSPGIPRFIPDPTDELTLEWVVRQFSRLNNSLEDVAEAVDTGIRIRANQFRDTTDVLFDTSSVQVGSDWSVFVPEKGYFWIIPEQFHWGAQSGGLSNPVELQIGLNINSTDHFPLYKTDRAGAAGSNDVSAVFGYLPTGVDTGGTSADKASGIWPRGGTSTAETNSGHEPWIGPGNAAKEVNVMSIEALSMATGNQTVQLRAKGSNTGTELRGTVVETIITVVMFELG